MAAPIPIPAYSARRFSTGVNAEVRDPPNTAAINPIVTKSAAAGSANAQNAASSPAPVNATVAMTSRRPGGGPPSRVLSPARSNAMQAMVWATMTTSIAANAAGFASGVP